MGPPRPSQRQPVCQPPLPCWHPGYPLCSSPTLSSLPGSAGCGSSSHELRGRVGSQVWGPPSEAQGQRVELRWLSGGAVVRNPPANAGDTGSSPGLGRSHVPRSGWAREPHLLSLRVWNLCSTTGEAATVRGPRTAMRSGPRSPQLEKALTQKRRPNTAINK